MTEQFGSSNRPAWLKWSFLGVAFAGGVSFFPSTREDFDERTPVFQSEALANVVDARRKIGRVALPLSVSNLPPSLEQEDFSASEEVPFSEGGHQANCDIFFAKRAEELSSVHLDSLYSKVQGSALDSLYEDVKAGCQALEPQEQNGYINVPFIPLDGLETNDPIEIPVFFEEDEGEEGEYENDDGLLLDLIHFNNLYADQDSLCMDSRFENSLSEFKKLELPEGAKISYEDFNRMEDLLNAGYDVYLKDGYLVFESNCSFVRHFSVPGSRSDVFSFEEFGEDSILPSSELNTFLEHVSSQLLGVEFDHFLDNFRGSKEDRELLEAAYVDIMAPLFSDLDNGKPISLDSICISMRRRALFLTEYPELEKNHSFDLLNKLYELTELHMVFNTVDSEGCDDGEA